MNEFTLSDFHIQHIFPHLHAEFHAWYVGFCPTFITSSLSTITLCFQLTYFGLIHF